MVVSMSKAKNKIKKKKLITETYPWRDGTIQYTIDTKNKTVTCVFTPFAEPENVDLYIRAKVMNNVPLGKTYLGEEPFGTWTKKSIGIAKCAEEDKFDVKIGKHVAFLKMRRDYHSRVTQIYHDLLKDIKMKYDAVQNLLDIEKENYKKLSDKIKTEAGII